MKTALPRAVGIVLCVLAPWALAQPADDAIEEVVFTTRSLSFLLSNGEVVTMVNSTAVVPGKGTGLTGVT